MEVKFCTFDDILSYNHGGAFLLNEIDIFKGEGLTFHNTTALGIVNVDINVYILYYENYFLTLFFFFLNNNNTN